MDEKYELELTPDGKKTLKDHAFLNLKKLEYLSKITSNLLWILIALASAIILINLHAMYSEIASEMDYKPIIENPALRGNFTRNLESGAQILTITPILLAAWFILILVSFLFYTPSTNLWKIFKKEKDV